MDSSNELYNMKLSHSSSGKLELRMNEKGDWSRIHAETMEKESLFIHPLFMKVIIFYKLLYYYMSEMFCLIIVFLISEKSFEKIIES
jgi:hypothetical protein